MMRDDRKVLGNVAPIAAEHELVQLTLRMAELQDSLEKAQRRIERLIGERSQLAVLLDKRDEQIHHLYRELGSPPVREVGAAPGTPASSFWRDLISSLVKSIGRAGETAGQPLAEQPGASDRDNGAKPAAPGFGRAPLTVNYKKASPKAVLAVIMFGLDDDEIRNFLPIIQLDCTKSNMMPLLLTDNDAFEILREHGLIFEYLPPAEDRERFNPKLSWDLYMQRRLAIIRRKWQPARVIALGQVAADMLRLWHQSPFEDIPLPAAVED